MHNSNSPNPIIFIVLAIILLLIVACNYPTIMISIPKIDLPLLQVIIRKRENNSPSVNSLLIYTPFPTIPSPTSTPTISVTPSITLTTTPTFSLTPTQTPTSTETATFLPTDTLVPELEQSFPPESAQIVGVIGYPQIYSLDCEARSAVDFAAFFGIAIDEMDFLDSLPKSDDPEQGFVGNYWDPKGNLPPDSYGVHAYPVAALLRDYGLNAYDIKGMSYENLQQEIASNRPVMVWVIGNTISGYPETYTALNGNITTVARFEHTIIVTGYQPSYITIADGDMIYYRSIDNYLNSWETLGRMAIIYEPE